jgi:hypothetical protein
MVKSRRTKNKRRSKTRKMQKNIGIIRGGTVNSSNNWFIRIVDNCTKYFWLNDSNWKEGVNIAKRRTTYNRTLKDKRLWQENQLKDPTPSKPLGKGVIIEYRSTGVDALQKEREGKPVVNMYYVPQSYNPFDRGVKMVSIHWKNERRLGPHFLQHGSGYRHIHFFSTNDKHLQSELRDLDTEIAGYPYGSKNQIYNVHESMTPEKKTQNMKLNVTAIGDWVETENFDKELAYCIVTKMLNHVTYGTQDETKDFISDQITALQGKIGALTEEQVKNLKPNYDIDKLEEKLNRYEKTPADVEFSQARFDNVFPFKPNLGNNYSEHPSLHRGIEREAFLKILYHFDGKITKEQKQNPGDSREFLKKLIKKLQRNEYVFRRQREANEDVLYAAWQANPDDQDSRNRYIDEVKRNDDIEKARNSKYLDYRLIKRILKTIDINNFDYDIITYDKIQEICDEIDLENAAAATARATASSRAGVV